MATRYPSSMGMRNAEGSIAKVIGVIFLVIGAYTLLTFYKVISFEIPGITQEQLFLLCALGSAICGIYMLLKGGSHHGYRY
jgi:hypothetical protein